MAACRMSAGLVRWPLHHVRVSSSAQRPESMLSPAPSDMAKRRRRALWRPSLRGWNASSYSAVSLPARGSQNDDVSARTRSPQAENLGADVEELHDGADVSVEHEAPPVLGQGQALLVGSGAHGRGE